MSLNNFLHDDPLLRNSVNFDSMYMQKIVTGYRLDDRAIEVRSLAEAKGFSSSLCVQTSSGAHPASCMLSTGGLFPRAKALLGRDTEHSPPSSAEVENE
jgi:hypothetical protein